MKRTLLISAVAFALVSAACTSPGKKTAIGAGVGAAAGAVAGAVIAHNTGGKAEKGAIIGAAAGLAAGGVIGNYYDKQAKELAKIAEVTKTNNGIEVNLKGEILFETGKAELSDQARQTLIDLNKVLKKYPSNIIIVEGYTDSTGSAAVNKTLSQQRAKAVYDFILANGLKTEALTYVGYGPANPIAANNTAEGRAKNRRVELKITTNKELIEKYKIKI
jgi:outer membrane protein OmpA-like peptidoglycan-associated protein